MKRGIIFGFLSVAVITGAVVLSFGSVAGDQIAVKLRWGRVIDSMHGPVRYFRVPFIEHVHVMQRRWSDTVRVANRQIILNIEVLDPKVFFLAYTGDRQTLVQMVEKNIAADNVLQAKLSMDSDVRYETAGVDIKLRLQRNQRQ